MAGNSEKQFMPFGIKLGEAACFAHSFVNWRGEMPFFSPKRKISDTENKLRVLYCL